MSSARGCIDVEDLITVYAIGDLEGDILLLYEFLVQNDILSFDEHDGFTWENENIYVVQCGDQVDRKRAELSDDHKAYRDFDMIIFTRILSRISGGRFISVLGNHEMMNCFGQFHYVADSNVDALYPGDRKVSNNIRKTLFDEEVLRESILERNFIVRINSLIFSHAGISSGMIRISQALRASYKTVDEFINEINSQLTDNNIDLLSEFRDVSNKELFKKFYGISNPILDSQLEKVADDIKKVVRSTSYLLAKVPNSDQPQKQYHFGVLWERNFNPKLFAYYMNQASTEAKELYNQYAVPIIKDTRGSYTQVIGHNSTDNKIYHMRFNQIWEFAPSSRIVGDHIKDLPNLFMIDSYSRGKDNAFNIKFLRFTLDGMDIKEIVSDECKITENGLSALAPIRYIKDKVFEGQELEKVITWLRPSNQNVESKKRQRLSEDVDRFVAKFNTPIVRARYNQAIDVLHALKDSTNYRKAKKIFEKIKSNYKALALRRGGSGAPTFNTGMSAIPGPKGNNLSSYVQDESNKLLDGTSYDFRELDPSKMRDVFEVENFLDPDVKEIEITQFANEESSTTISACNRYAARLIGGYARQQQGRAVR